jgi:hypothetical protein
VTLSRRRPALARNDQDIGVERIRHRHHGREPRLPRAVSRRRTLAGFVSIARATSALLSPCATRSAFEAIDNLVDRRDRTPLPLETPP